ncbi:MAG: ribose-phosphate pyrophosphokinase [Alphaproteobacteria bacterium]|nr:ribose-phosphate pyrophosphokinase [Alphaproteobacteria bacterium]
MTSTALISLPGNESLAASIADAIGARQGRIEIRRFPDDETYLRFGSDVAGQDVILLCTLDRPDSKILALLFAAATARELGAHQVGLIAPYLSYMRQDRRFKSGEAVTSRCFARILSEAFDWLATVDPHLHRLSSLEEIYTVPARAVHAAPLVSDWIRETVDDPVLVGPDSESEQWVAAVAGDAGAPHLVLQKVRHGDRDVEISVPDIEQWRHRRPVLVDDIISTGRTMIETVGHLKRLGMRAPVCVGVHGIFAGAAFRDLNLAGASQVVTTNTVVHESNAIDVAEILAEAVLALTGDR